MMRLLSILTLLACFSLVTWIGCSGPPETQKSLKGTWERIDNKSTSMKMAFAEDGNQVFFMSDDEVAFVFDLIWMHRKWQLKSCDWPNNYVLRIGITSDDEVCIAPTDEDETEYHKIQGRYKRHPFEIDLDALAIEE